MPTYEVKEVQDMKGKKIDDEEVIAVALGEIAEQKGGTVVMDCMIFKGHGKLELNHSLVGLGCNVQLQECNLQT